MENQKPHLLLVTFPAQGHINPALQFAKRVLQAGADVTFATASSGNLCLEKAIVPDGMAFATFSDGYDNGFKAVDGDIQDYLSMFRQRGANAMAELIKKSSAEGKPITCLVHTILLPWASEVARELHVPSALLWIQPALVFDIYYYYFNGYQYTFNDCEKDPSWSLELPNLPFKLKSRDLPSFLLPSNSLIYTFALPTFKQEVEELEKEEKPIILVNTFEALEVHALKSIEKFNLIPIGPLLPSPFLNVRDPLDNSVGENAANYMKWLDSQEKHSSVIYVSFGSMSVLSRAQMEELARSLIQTHRPFLWVIRENTSPEKDSKEGNEVDEILSCMEQLKQQGLIVPWCSQVEVLSHPSVGCFVTHCGWNSTLESLTAGVPMVAFPQWTDQTTNARLVEDVWETGVKAKASEEEGGLVKSEEITRCLEKVMESEEIKENAKKWKNLAIEAVKEGGSSDRNLKAFMKELFQC